VKLAPRQLESHLADGIGSLYLVSGDEPLLVDETVDRLRRAARDEGCDEREVYVAERGFDWSSLRAGLSNLSLFSSKQLIELRLPTGKPGDAGARQLVEIAEQPPADKLLIVITPKLPAAASKSKWVTRLAAAGVWIPLQAPSAEALPRWLTARVQQAGLQCEPEAIKLLASRVEGNLLAAKQEIDKLMLLAEDGKVDVKTVQAAVGDGARYDVFQLADAALAGDDLRVARILQHLQQEGIAATLVLWSLVREIASLSEVAGALSRGDSAGRALKAAGVWSSREQLVMSAVRRCGGQSAQQLLDQAALVDRIVKGARPGQPWPALLDLGLALSRGSPAAGIAA
jgi:DNA polymerase-3 subunit delta